MLHWQQEEDGAAAISGELVIGQIGRLKADPSTWWYSVDAVSLRHIAKAKGHVKSRDAARRGVERAWQRWLSLAGLEQQS